MIHYAIPCISVYGARGLDVAVPGDCADLRVAGRERNAVTVGLAIESRARAGEHGSAGAGILTRRYFGGRRGGTQRPEKSIIRGKSGTPVSLLLS